MSVIATVYTYGLILYCGLLFVVHLLWDWLKNPRLTIFTVKERPKPPACLLDPSYGTHSYVTVNGIKIHYVEKGDKTKPLMLFLHGFPEFWYSWRYQIKEFSKDYWTVAVDMRGYGESDKPSGVENYTVKLLVDDVAKIIKALGREKCILVGHDWGGAVAWRVVAVHPDMVERYVIMNVPPAHVFKRMLETHEEQRRKSRYMFVFQLPILAELFVTRDDLKLFDVIFKKKTQKPPTVSEEDIEAFKYYFSKPGALSGPLNYYRAFIRGPKSSVSSAVPSGEPPRGLFIFGEKDDFISVDVVEKSEKSVKNLSTKIIQDANHFVQQDEPVIVNKAMREFLNTK